MKSKFVFIIILLAALTLACESAPKKVTKPTKPIEEKADPSLKDTIVDYKEFYEDGTIKGEGKALYKIIMNKPKKIKQEHWILYYQGPGKTKMAEGEYKDDVQVGKWTFFFKDGVKKQEGIFTEGLATGIWTIFYPTGEENWKATFIVIDKMDDVTNQVKKVSVLDGKKTTYFKNSKVQKEEEFKKGVKTGRSQEYYLSGNPKEMLQFKEDKKNGGFNEFWDGKRKTEGSFIDDKKTGYWKMYYNTGQLAIEGAFANDKPDGQWKFYSREGQLQKEGKYKAGKEDGLWVFYTYENGKKYVAMELPLEGGMAAASPGKFYDKGVLIGTGTISGIVKGLYQVYKNSQPTEIIEGQNPPEDDPANGVTSKWTGKWRPLKKNGLWIEYYPGSKSIKFEAMIQMDKKNGEYREYYPNGKIRAEGKYQIDKKNDQWKFYNQDGSIDESQSGLYLLDKKR